MKIMISTFFLPILYNPTVFEYLLEHFIFTVIITMIRSIETANSQLY